MCLSILALVIVEIWSVSSDYSSTHIGKDRLSFEQARKVCKDLPSPHSLPTISSMEDNLHLHRVIITESWLAYQRHSLEDWSYFDGSMLSDQEKSVAASINKDCGTVDLQRRTIKYDFHHCNLQGLSYLCEKKNCHGCSHIGFPGSDCVWRDNRCYIHSCKAENWYDARAKCLRIGGELAKLNNDSLIQLMRDLQKDKMYKHCKPSWIGSRREVWSSASGKEIEYISLWGPREPSVGGNCSLMTKSQTSNRFVWKAVDCEELHEFICVFSSGSVTEGNVLSSVPIDRSENGTSNDKEKATVQPSWPGSHWNNGHSKKLDLLIGLVGSVAGLVIIGAVLRALHIRPFRRRSPSVPDGYAMTSLLKAQNVETKASNGACKSESALLATSINKDLNDVNYYNENQEDDKSTFRSVTKREIREHLTEDTLNPQEGTPWENQYEANHEGGRFQRENSLVSLQVPPEAIESGKTFIIKENIHLNCIKYVNEMTETLAGPVVEYETSGRFRRHVVIRIPHCVPEKLSPLVGVFFRSNNKESWKEIKKNDTRNNIKETLYWEWFGDHVKVYTLHFTQFKCVCKQRSSKWLDLQVMLFGHLNEAYEPARKRHLLIHMYLVDQLHTIKDYRKDLAQREQCEPLPFHASIPLSNVTGIKTIHATDKLEVELHVIGGSWDRTLHSMVKRSGPDEKVATDPQSSSILRPGRSSSGEGVTLFLRRSLSSFVSCHSGSLPSPLQFILTTENMQDTSFAGEFQFSVLFEETPDKSLFRIRKSSARKQYTHKLEASLYFIIKMSQLKTGNIPLSYTLKEAINLVADNLGDANDFDRLLMNGFRYSPKQKQDTLISIRNDNDRKLVAKERLLEWANDTDATITTLHDMLNHPDVNILWLAEEVRDRFFIRNAQTKRESRRPEKRETMYESSDDRKTKCTDRGIQTI